jgi:uncharacterized membrane protein YgdD (TMEM256/DUF423 family)
MTAHGWLATGALSAAMAVICGAFAAHGLDKWLPEKYEGQTRIVAGETIHASRKYLADFKTAAEYQMYHALGLIAVAVVAMSAGGGAGLNAAGWSFLLGTILFSGSLYALVLTGVTKLGMITPIGGLLFIAGWVLLAVAGFSGQAGRGAAP